MLGDGVRIIIILACFRKTKSLLQSYEISERKGKKRSFFFPFPNEK